MELEERRKKVLEDMGSLAKEEVLAEIDKLRGWARWPRIFFRTAGSLIILLSISLPVVAASGWPRKDLILSLAGLSVALLTAFNTFFAWDQTWRTNHTTVLMLGNALSIWKYELLKAQHAQDPEKGIEIAHDAHARLVEAVNLLKTQNAAAYFSGVKPPKDPEGG